jgi:membrane-bound serine protease (ClpP class)
MRRSTPLVRLLSSAAATLALALLVLAAPARAAGPAVVVLPTTGDVDGVMAQYLVDGIARAEREGAPAVLVELNTPGGSLDATQQITGAFLDSTVPVIVWVAPAGGRAASAGTFITLAANLVYMAPGTNIGAASPVDSSGADITGTLGLKVMNDAVANISAIAQARGRPVAWAASTVSAAKSYWAGSPRRWSG